MGLVSFLFKLARVSADVKAISSGSPKRVARRAKNKVVGRLLRKAGVWRWLWR